MHPGLIAHERLVANAMARFAFYSQPKQSRGWTARQCRIASSVNDVLRLKPEIGA
jgi:hypothetical protein